MAHSVVVYGVSGSGKTTVARHAAQLANMPFCDADDLHPASNVMKIMAGHPLDDADRAPWLDDVASTLSARAPVIVACSALRRAYRDRLRSDAPQTLFVLLTAPRAELTRRLIARQNHFMSSDLLDSQLAALEAPGVDEGILVLDAVAPVAELAAAVARLAVPRVD